MNKKFIIRTSGIALYLLLFMFAAVFLMLTDDALKFGFRPESLLFLSIIGIVCGFLLNQKIEIKDNQLITRTTGFGKLLSLYKTNLIELNNIDSVTIATIRYFEEHREEFKDESLRNLINSYRRNRAVVGGDVIVPLGFAAKSIPLMYIKSKDGSKNFAVTAKIFSKEGFKKLIQEFQKYNILVVTEPALDLFSKISFSDKF